MAPASRLNPRLSATLSVDNLMLALTTLRAGSPVGGPRVIPIRARMNTDSSDPNNQSVGGWHRYDELTIGTGECIIYDRENHRAWIQSTVAAPITECD